MVITPGHLELLDTQTAERTGRCAVDSSMALSLVPPPIDDLSPPLALPPSPRNLRVYKGKLFLLVRIIQLLPF